MKLDHITYTGPAIDDEATLARLPRPLADHLTQINGYIQFHGGLHVRGACLAPAWHSLRDAWEGETAFHQLYPDVKPSDVPFAEDCLGDQFLLRGGQVWRLFAETGELESLEVNFKEFLQEVAKDAVEFLGFHPLMEYEKDGGQLKPGQLLAAYPPFCTEEAEDGVTVSAVPTDERRRFLADFAAKVNDLPDDGQIDVNVKD